MDRLERTEPQLTCHQLYRTANRRKFVEHSEREHGGAVGSVNKMLAVSTVVVANLAEAIECKHPRLSLKQMSNRWWVMLHMSLCCRHSLFRLTLGAEVNGWQWKRRVRAS